MTRKRDDAVGDAQRSGPARPGACGPPGTAAGGTPRRSCAGSRTQRGGRPSRACDGSSAVALQDALGFGEHLRALLLRRGGVEQEHQVVRGVLFRHEKGAPRAANDYSGNGSGEDARGANGRRRGPQEGMNADLLHRIRWANVARAAAVLLALALVVAWPRLRPHAAPLPPVDGRARAAGPGGHDGARARGRATPAGRHRAPLRPARRASARHGRPPARATVATGRRAAHRAGAPSAGRRPSRPRAAGRAARTGACRPGGARRPRRRRAAPRRPAPIPAVARRTGSSRVPVRGHSRKEPRGVPAAGPGHACAAHRGAARSPMYAPQRCGPMSACAARQPGSPKEHRIRSQPQEEHREHHPAGRPDLPRRDRGRQRRREDRHDRRRLPRRAYRSAGVGCGQDRPVRDEVELRPARRRTAPTRATSASRTSKAPGQGRPEDRRRRRAVAGGGAAALPALRAATTRDGSDRSGTSACPGPRRRATRDTGTATTRGDRRPRHQRADHRRRHDALRGGAQRRHRPSARPAARACASTS